MEVGRTSAAQSEVRWWEFGGVVKAVVKISSRNSSGGRISLKAILLALVLLCSAMVSATVYEIGAGEYWYGVEVENNDTLIVNGGGASGIDAFDSSSIQVNYTSAPLSLYVGGIASITIQEGSTLDFYGGLTGNIYITDSATATLSGGSINNIRSYQDVGWWAGQPVGQHIEMVVRSYDYNASTNLLSGVWDADYDNDGQFDTFSIQLHNQTGYDSVIDNIKFTIVTPEPTTLFLLGFGTFILRGNNIQGFLSERRSS